MSKPVLIWPKPADDARAKIWSKGQIFALVGGPADGILVRLLPSPYIHRGMVHPSGWDSLPFGDDMYVRPDTVDPYMKRPGKVNKKQTNVPTMQWVEA